MYNSANSSHIFLILTTISGKSPLDLKSRHTNLMRSHLVKEICTLLHSNLTISTFSTFSLLKVNVQLFFPVFGPPHFTLLSLVPASYDTLYTQRLRPQLLYPFNFGFRPNLLFYKCIYICLLHTCKFETAYISRQKSQS